MYSYSTEALFHSCSVSPRVSSPDRIEIHEFDSTTVTCTAAANPAPVSNDYKWFNPDGYQNSSSSELTVTRAIKKDAGGYICHVSVWSNEYGLLNGTSHTMVNVLCKLFIPYCFLVKTLLQLLIDITDEEPVQYHLKNYHFTIYIPFTI